MPPPLIDRLEEGISQIVAFLPQLGMALGILLDTFLIRPLLVPAIVTMLDRKALWPMRIRDNGRETAEQPA